MNQDWKQNTVAELIHGPCDGSEIPLPPSMKTIEVIEVPIYEYPAMVNILSRWCDKKEPIKIGVYRRIGSTLRLHSGAPATVKFRYQETREDREHTT